jgi:glycosyltransferase involved in cell wall biosynthesis
VPCYNEQEVLPETAERLLALRQLLIKRGAIEDTSRICFVDDGSKDGTWNLIEELANRKDGISGIKLSKNRGHQNALMAGLFTMDGDALVSIDADLQDDINVIEKMVAEFHNGVDIVYGVRKRRETDSFFKRISAELFYKFLSLLGAESMNNHADYRLMSRRAIESLKGFKEVNLYLRGIIPLLGFRSSVVHYDRLERFAGTSKYPLKKMIALALDGVTSFSVSPLRFIMFIGFTVFLGTVFVMIWIVWTRFFSDRAVPGWASTVLPMFFLGGVQILCIGVIGEYLGKIYGEVKGRPRYIIEKVI